MTIAPALLALPLLLPTAGDPPPWGGFRGNNGAGVALDTRIPNAFDRDANLLWRAEVPPGYSSPVVAAGRVFVTGVERGALVTVCLDAVGGNVEWMRAVEGM